MGLFAISPALIYYSAEVKQYSSDVAIALLLYCLTIEGSKSEWKAGRTALAALAGAIAIWMSHSSIFVLAGIGATISIALVLRKDWARLARVFVVGLCWMASLAVCYIVACGNWRAMASCSTTGRRISCRFRHDLWRTSSGLWTVFSGSSVPPPD